MYGSDDFIEKCDEVSKLRAALVSEAETRQKLWCRIFELHKIIEKMNELHIQCFENGCTCYSDIDGVCVFCNKSTKLSDLANKAISDNEKYRDNLYEEIANILPSTYYADRPLEERVQFLVDHWRKLVTLLNENENKK